MKITYNRLKKLLRESINDNWKWCVAEYNRWNGKYEMVSYDAPEPYPGDVSAERVPRGYYVGYCRTMTERDAAKMIDLLEAKPYNKRKTFMVVSRFDFEKNTWTERDYWEAEVDGGRFYNRGPL